MFWEILTTVALVYCGVLSVILIAVMRQVGSLLLLINPDFPIDVAGGPELGSQVDLPGVAPGQPAVVVFIAPGCTACMEVMPSIPKVASAFPDVAVLASVAQPSTPAGRELIEKLPDLARPELERLQETWGVPGTPYAVSISREWRIATRGVVNTLDQLTTMAELAQAATFDDAEEAGVRLNEEAATASVSYT